MDATRSLPAIRTITLGSPFTWLAEGWRDLMTAPGPLLAYGLAVAVASRLHLREASERAARGRSRAQSAERIWRGALAYRKAGSA